jgi:hypothetical protein
MVNQNIKLPLSSRNQLVIRKRTPPGLRHAYNFMVGESLIKARIDALV